MPNFRTKIPNHFDLPRRIDRLGELAYNLWWTWNPSAHRLYYRIDYALWERLNHNPILFLRSVGRSEVNAAAQNPAYLENYDRVFASFDAYMNSTETWCTDTYDERCNQQWAYFSMEFGLHETLPLYSGGLGVLAGDYLKESIRPGPAAGGNGPHVRGGVFLPAHF